MFALCSGKSITLASIAFLPLLMLAQRSGFQGPDSHQSFDEATAGMHVLLDYTFGTNSGRAVRSLDQLAKDFEPYGIAGTTVINDEWERYQPFNPENFVLKPTSLDLTATIPKKGGLFAGGIHSGQIWSKQTFQPGKTGHQVYAFDVRMKIPAGRGMWPAFWLYAKSGMPGMNDGSEIDHPEFFNMSTQNELDWTGYSHGPGVGDRIYSIATKGIWHPKINFSADYHDYQTLWTQDAVYKYVDGKLIDAWHFKWTSRGAAQFGADLAVGSSNPNMPGLKPVSETQFPSALSIEYIRVLAGE